MIVRRIAGWARERAGSLPRQFALVVAIVVAPVLVALVVVGSLMVVSDRGAALVAAIVAAAGLVAIIAARLVAGGILRDVEAIRDGLVAVGRGKREVRIETSAHDELAQLAAAANVMIVQLRDEEAARDQSEAARRDLIAAVSHDLRTPITSLRLLAEAIGDDIFEDPETRRSYLRRMTTHIDALSVLIDDLFELSRLEAGDISWTIEQVPLQELVGETVEAMRVQAEAKGVAVVAEVPDTLCPAQANPEKLQRVLFNLIQNAIRHTPADGSVVVRAEPVADRDRVRGRRHRRRDPPRGARVRVHRVLSRRHRGRAHEPGRRTRAGGVARDRRGARRPHLAGGRQHRHARPVQLAGGDVAPPTPGGDVAPPTSGGKLPAGRISDKAGSIRLRGFRQ